MSFFKKHKVWGSVIGIIVVLVVGFSVFLTVKAVVVSNTDCPTERHYVEFMTGVVEPMMSYFIGPGDIARMKEDNMNTLQVYFNQYAPALIYQLERPFLLGIIKEAKKQGMAVHVAGNTGPSGSSEGTTEEKIEIYTRRVLEWAEYCEECGVEYFSPMAEADLLLDRDRAIEWHTEILPQIREVFSGKVLAHWSCYSPDDVEMQQELEKKGEGWDMIDAYCYRVEASGDFDGVMLDFQLPTPLLLKYWFDPDKPLEEGDPYRPDSLETIAIATSEIADELGIPIYVGEFHVKHVNLSVGDLANSAVFSDEERAEFFEKFIDTFSPYYDGIIHCGWDIEGKVAEQAMKKKFGELIK